MTQKPIFLCGFMGCGKTTVGKRLAKLLGCDFTDMDDYIEKNEGKTISEIFAENGEEYFRRVETETIKSFEGISGVIATGGGALLSEENGNAAKKIGVTVFINAKFSTCYLRIKDDPKRPIASSNTREQLYDLYMLRMPKYLKSSMIVVDGNKKPNAIAEAIIKELRITE